MAPRQRECDETDGRAIAVGARRQAIKYAWHALAVRVLNICEYCLVRTSTGAIDSIRYVRYRVALALIFEPRDTDIFVVSYPKAGTTVMQMMLYQVLTDGELSFLHIDQVVPWFEQWLLATDPVALRSQTSRRAFKTHLRLPKLPHRGRFIYLLRNPKDSCVSYYYHTFLVRGWRSPLSTFGERFLTGRVTFGSWFRHFKVCCRNAASRQVLLVNYDDIILDLPAVVDRVAKFCDRDLDAETRARVIERCSFSFMKERNSMFEPTKRALLGDLQFIRKGKPGDWVSELTPAMSRAIDRKLATVLESLGPAASEPYRAAVQSRPSSVDGTVSVPLHTEMSARLIEDGVSPHKAAVVVPRPDGTRVGDVVRVTFVGRSSRAIAERAVVSSIDKEGTETGFTATLNLLDIVEEEMNKLRQLMKDGVIDEGAQAYRPAG